jgi:ribosome biogenesis GTPase
VGKSTLLSLLLGIELAVGDVSGKHSQGRHTTTTSRIYHLPHGGSVVDTPGIREFLVPDSDWLDVHEYFADIAALTSGCGYRNCTHTVEPGCAVKAAVERGELPSGRLRSYIGLRREAGVPDHLG